MAYYENEGYIVVFDKINAIYIGGVEYIVVHTTAKEIYIPMAEKEEFLKKYAQWLSKNAQTSYKPRGQS